MTDIAHPPDAAHLCSLYGTPEERVAALAPYVRGGIEGNERVICVADAPATAAVVADLLAHGLDPVSLRERGQLRFMPSDEGPPPEDALDRERAISRLRADAAAALREGYAGLRLSVEMTWLLEGRASPAQAVAPAVHVDGPLAGVPSTVLCEYDRERFAPADLLDALRTHPFVVIGTALRDNPHFVPPSVFDGAEGEAVQLAAWLDGLAQGQAAEDALGEARLRLERTIEGTGAGTWETNLQAGTGKVSERWAAIIGYTVAELGPPGAEMFRTLTHPDDLVRADDLLARHLAGELPDYGCELRMRHKDGHWVWIESRGRLLLRTGDGQPLLMFGIHLDISERRTAEEALRVSHARLRQFFDANIVGIVIAAPDGRIIEANDYYLETLGFTREEAERGEVDWRAVTPSEWKAADDAALAELRERGVATGFEKEYLHRDGRRVPVYIVGAVQPGSDEVATFVLDISDRRLAGEALRQSEQRYRQLFDSASDAVYVIDTETLRIVDANEMASVMSGYGHDELVTLTSPALSAEPQKTEAFVREADAGTGAVPVVQQRLHRRKDGTVYPVEFSSRTVVRDGRSLLLVACRDVTERDAAAEAVRQLALLLDTAPNAITVHDLDGRVVYANPKTFEMHGYRPDEVTNLDVRQIAGPDADGRAGDWIAAARAGGTRAYEVEHARRDGSVLPLAVTVAPTTWGGRPAVLSIATDITDRRMAEQARRAEMIGRLAGGVAQKFNNELTAIGGYAELLAASIDDSDPRQEDVRAIREATIRSAVLTRQLLAFGRRETLKPVTVPVGEVVAGLDAILAGLVPAGISLIVGNRPGVGSVLVDRAHLENAIVNLVLNARDAMPDGGTLTIDWDEVEVDAADPRLRPPAAAGRYVRLTVADTGAGIEARLLPHIFEPFFTTKPFGHGSGLGLSSVEGFVAQSGGFVTVDSREGAGSILSIFLPRASANVAPVRGAGVSGAVARGTVLLVEDEATVRAALVRMMGGLGYAIVEAASGADALRLEEVGTAFDVLVTDVVMPAMNGRELARHLGSRRPGLPVLFMSGYAPEAVFDGGMLDRDAAFLAKPFARADLASALGALFARREAGLAETGIPPRPSGAPDRPG